MFGLVLKLEHGCGGITTLSADLGLRTKENAYHPGRRTIACDSGKAVFELSVVYGRERHTREL